MENDLSRSFETFSSFKKKDKDKNPDIEYSYFPTVNKSENKTATFHTNGTAIVNNKENDNLSLNTKASYIYSNSVEFYLILIGYVVGYGSFWRFPYLVFNNGGGIFVLIFAILLFVIGIPMFYLETFYGQMLRHGPVETFIMINKKFSGVGWAMVATTWMLSVYYGLLLVWSYYFFFASFVSPLPWSNVNKFDDEGKALPTINTVRFY